MASLVFGRAAEALVRIQQQQRVQSGCSRLQHGTGCLAPCCSSLRSLCLTVMRFLWSYARHSVARSILGSGADWHFRISLLAFNQRMFSGA